MDAIECGIVKLPRVPVADNVPGADMPRFRKLWEHIGRKMPKQGRGKAGTLDPLSLPLDLKSALDALYGHYERIFEEWRQAGISAPPCFIIVCNNTSTSKLVYDYISGFERATEVTRARWFKSQRKGTSPLFYTPFDPSSSATPPSPASQSRTRTTLAARQPYPSRPRTPRVRRWA